MSTFIIITITIVFLGYIWYWYQYDNNIAKRLLRKYNRLSSVEFSNILRTTLKTKLESTTTFVGTTVIVYQFKDGSAARVTTNNEKVITFELYGKNISSQSRLTK